MTRAHLSLIGGLGGLGGLAGLALVAPAARAADVITFDDLTNEPGIAGGAPFFQANEGAPGGVPDFTTDGVTFSNNAIVLGAQADNFVNGRPYVVPHSGDYALAAGSGSQALRLTTAKTLSGLYLGQIDDGVNGNGSSSSAGSVTISALGMNGTALATLTDPITGTTEDFFATGAFADLTGIAAYTLTPGGGMTDFALDDLTFAPAASPAPEPSQFGMLALLGLGLGGLILRARRK